MDASSLAAWSNFYVIVGSSSAALTGLMFVVITLVRSEERTQRTRDGISTFSTPTVTHFAGALLVSVILSAPWRSLVHPALLLGLVGLCNILYLLRVLLRTLRLKVYSPDLEDWSWYTILPFVAYIAILTGAIMLPFASVEALFTLAAGAASLIFIGVRNAWDVVTFLAIEGPPS